MNNIGEDIFYVKSKKIADPIIRKITRRIYCHMALNDYIHKQIDNNSVLGQVRWNNLMMRIYENN